jgi:hypothetical protein
MFDRRAAGLSTDGDAISSVCDALVWSDLWAYNKERIPWNVSMVDGGDLVSTG